MNIPELIKAIQEGRAQVIAATRGEAARGNAKHPPYVKAFLPDDIVKALGGADVKKRPQVFVVVVPHAPLIVTPGIILPGGAK